MHFLGLKAIHFFHVSDHSGSGGLLSKRFNSTSLAVGPLGNLGDLSTSLNPYEKWSNGSDKMFDHHTSDSILELSSKLLTLGKWDLLMIISKCTYSMYLHTF